MKKTINYCCLIANQLDLIFQKKEVANSHQLNSFFTKLAIDLLLQIKKEPKLCVLCENYLTNLKHFTHQEKAITKAKALLTPQDLVEEIVNRVEKGEMPASQALWTNLLYLYTKRDWEVCFGDQRWGYKGFSIPDQYFYPRQREKDFQKLKQVSQQYE